MFQITRSKTKHQWAAEKKTRGKTIYIRVCSGGFTRQIVLVRGARKTRRFLMNPEGKIDWTRHYLQIRKTGKKDAPGEEVFGKG